MPATIGFGHFSWMAFTSRSPGSFGGLPNSVMSAPAMKVRPSQTSATARTAGSAAARSTPSLMPARTAWASAFTGGLSTVMTATSPSVS